MTEIGEAMLIFYSVLNTLITSKTRIKLVLKFFSNENNKAYLRGLSQELGENTNAIRIELKRLTRAGLLQHENVGNTVLYRANTSNPFFKVLHKLVIKYMGLDDIVEHVVSKVGAIDLAFIRGDYAQGDDSSIIDLVLVGNIFDKPYLDVLHKKAEEISGRRIQILTLCKEEFRLSLNNQVLDKSLILWASIESGYTVALAYQP